MEEFRGDENLLVGHIINFLNLLNVQDWPGRPLLSVMMSVSSQNNIKCIEYCIVIRDRSKFNLLSSRIS